MVPCICAEPSLSAHLSRLGGFQGIWEMDRSPDDNLQSQKSAGCCASSSERRTKLDHLIAYLKRVDLEFEANQVY